MLPYFTLYRRDYIIIVNVIIGFAIRIGYNKHDNSSQLYLNLAYAYEVVLI